MGRFDFPGVRSGQKLDTTVVIDVPAVDVPSVAVSLFSVEYVIKCQAVHDIFGKVFIDEKAVNHKVALCVPPPIQAICLDAIYVL